MTGLVTTLRAELYVARRSTAARLLILVPALVVVLRAVIVRLSQSGQQARDALIGQGNPATADNAWGQLVDGFNVGLTMLGLMLVAYTAWSFASERDSGALRHLLIRSASRGGVVLAKLIAAHLLALCALLVMTLGIVVITTLLWDFGPVTEDGYELIGSAEIRSEVALGLKLALLPIPAALAFSMLVGVCAQSATQAVTGALGLTLALDIFKGLLGDAAYYLYATFQPSLIDQSYLQDVGRLVRGYSDVMIDNRAMALNLWIPWPQMLLFVVLALLIVRRTKL